MANRADAAMPHGFSAVAIAAGTRVTYSIPGFVVIDTFVDAGGPLSEAHMSEFERRGQASFPYPGQLTFAAPALLAVGLGQAPPEQTHYPLVATSSDPVAPESEVGSAAGPYHLKSVSSEKQAMASARVGPTDGDGARSGSRARADVTEDGGAILSSAEALTVGFEIPGVLALGYVLSRSVTKYEVGTKPVTQGQLVIEGGRAGDLDFRYGPEGFVIGGSKAGSTAEGLRAINDALKPAGVTVRIAPASDGGTTEVLRIESVHEVSSLGAKGVLEYELGRASSKVEVADASDGAGPPPTEGSVHSQPPPHDDLEREARTDDSTASRAKALLQLSKDSGQTSLVLGSTTNTVPVPVVGAGVHVPFRAAGNHRDQGGSTKIVETMLAGVALLGVVSQGRAGWKAS